MKDFYEVLFVPSECPLKTLELFESVFAVANLSKVVLAWWYFLFRLAIRHRIRHRFVPGLIISEKRLSFEIRNSLNYLN